MVDVVANNMAYAGDGNKTDYKNFVPFDSESYFHPYCPITNYGNYTDAQEVRLRILCSI